MDLRLSASLGSSINLDERFEETEEQFEQHLCYCFKDKVKHHRDPRYRGICKILASKSMEEL